MGVHQAGLRSTGLDEALVHWQQAALGATPFSGGHTSPQVSGFRDVSLGSPNSPNDPQMGCLG